MAFPASHHCSNFSNQMIPADSNNLFPDRLAQPSWNQSDQQNPDSVSWTIFLGLQLHNTVWLTWSMDTHGPSPAASCWMAIGHLENTDRISGSHWQWHCTALDADITPICMMGPTKVTRRIVMSTDWSNMQDLNLSHRVKYVRYVKDATHSRELCHNMGQSDLSFCWGQSYWNSMVGKTFDK